MITLITGLARQPIKTKTTVFPTQKILTDSTGVTKIGLGDTVNITGTIIGIDINERHFSEVKVLLSNGTQISMQVENEQVTKV